MRRVVVVLCRFTVCCFLAGLVSGGVASAAPGKVRMHQDFPPRPGATPIVIGLPNLNPPTVTPGPAHSNLPIKSAKRPTPPDAARVALSNGYVRSLVSGKPYRVKSVDPWPTGPGKIVRVAFYHPVTISGTWLTAGKAPYRATYRNVQSIKIFVNMRRPRVVATVPYPRSRAAS